MTAVSARFRAVRDLLPAAAMLAIFLPLDRWLYLSTRLSAEEIAAPVLLPQAMRGMIGPLALIAVALAALAVWRPALLAGWNRLEHGGRLRAFVAVVLFVLAWDFSTYEPNHWVGQVHAVDRLLLLAFAAAALFRPLFLLPFLLVLYPIIWQFDVPLGAHMWGIELSATRLLILFLAAWVVTAITGKRRADDYVYLAVCVFAVGYWWPGFGKLRLGWFLDNPTHDIVAAAHTHGWHRSWTAERVAEFARACAPLDPLGRAGTLLFEVGAPLVLVWRRITPWFFVGWIGFHAGVFLMVGYVFWKWALIGAAFLFLIGVRGVPRFALWNPVRAVASVAVIVGLPLVLWPITQLAWYDTGLSYALRYEAVDAQGRRWDWAAPEFAPFTDRFVMSMFDAVTPEAHATGPYGVTKTRDVAEAVRRASHMGIMWVEMELCAREGNDYDPARRAAFESFVRDFVRHRNETRGARPWWRRIAPPSMLQCATAGPRWPEDSPVVRVDVDLVVAFFDGKTYEIVRRNPISRIEIEPRPARPPSPTPEGSRST
ncbi:MAG: hypothetical protein R3B81_15010 [bacterium]